MRLIFCLKALDKTTNLCYNKREMLLLDVLIGKSKVQILPPQPTDKELSDILVALYLFVLFLGKEEKEK